jgi:hypothetical protein
MTTPEPEPTASEPTVSEPTVSEPTVSEPTASEPIASVPPVPDVAPVAPPAAPPAPPAAPPVSAAAIVPAQTQTFPDGKPMFDASGRPASPKSRLAAALLCWFLGVFGIHRFYVGKVGTGIAMIFTLGGLGVWALIDFIVILVGSFKDKEERVLSNW